MKENMMNNVTKIIITAIVARTIIYVFDRLTGSTPNPGLQISLSTKPKKESEE